MAFPHGCGAVYDGGRMCTSRHRDTNFAKRNCKPEEAEGSLCATTISSIQRATWERKVSTPSTVEVDNASHAVTLCLVNVAFARDHVKHSRVLTSPGISTPALDPLTAAANDVLMNVNSLSKVLRVAAIDAVMLFLTLLIFSHAKGA